MNARILIISIAVIAAIIVGVMLTAYLTYDPYNPVEKIACENRGGTYSLDHGTGGRDDVRTWYCQMPVSDKGKECTDSSQCIEICIAENEDDAAGMCTGYYNTGCYFWEMSNGKAHEGCIVN